MALSPRVIDRQFDATDGVDGRSSARIERGAAGPWLDAKAIQRWERYSPERRFTPRLAVAVGAVEKGSTIGLARGVR